MSLTLLNNFFAIFYEKSYPKICILKILYLSLHYENETINTNKTMTMLRMNQTTYKAVAERKIEMYNANIAFFDRLIEFGKNYDGKKMDKRFIDKVAAFAPTHCRLVFDTDFYGKRENRFRTIYDDRYISSVNAYLDQWDYTHIIYKDYTAGDYINTADFTLNYANFEAALMRQREQFVTNRDELIYAKEHTADIIATYEEMSEYIKTKMATIPSSLRQSVNISCPIY